MGLWKEHVVPRLVERSCGLPMLDEWRHRACEPLHGRVLEVGFGSGLNLRHYPAEVVSVAAVEPSDLAWRISRGRRHRSRVPVERVGLDGEHIDAPDASFDDALVTFSLCSIPEPGRALAEVRRLLRAGGTLQVLEHGLAPDRRVARWQRRLEPVHKRVAGGCHLTRDVPAMLRNAGFEVTELEQRYLPTPAMGRPWAFGTLASAVPTRD